MRDSGCEMPRSSRSIMLVLAALTGVAAAGGARPAPAEIRIASQNVAVGGRRYAAQVLRVRLGSARFRVGLAQGRVGPVEPLDAIARRYGAAAAINGTFFEAYEKGPIRMPNHTLITNGQVVEKGNIGTLIGFTGAGQAMMGRVPLRIEGAL